MSTVDSADRTGTRAIRLLTIGLALWVVAGCISTRTKLAIPPFRQGVVTAQQQTTSAFADVNRFLREQQLERAITQPALTEDLFFPGLDPEDITKWNRAFTIIDDYAGKIERLLNPDQRASVETEIVTLGEKIEAVSDEELPLGISAAFRSLGGLLVQWKSEKDALEAIQRADPGIQQVFGAMMEAIGPDHESGIRGTVWTSWSQVLARVDVGEFRPAEGESAKRAVAIRYIGIMDERDTQDQLLSSLRLSLSALGRTHQEIARGETASAGAFIQLIQDEYKAYRENLKAMRDRHVGDTTAGGNP